MPWQKPSTSHARFKHGRSHTTEYTIWRGMVRRCHDATTKAYRFYGLVGVTVCEEWRTDFLNFLHDMGPRPSQAHTLDRIDTRGCYSRDNCRWATRDTQANNTRANHRITFNDETLTVSQWARRVGVTVATMNSRIRRGWPLDKMMSYKADMAPLPRRPRRTMRHLCHCGEFASARGLCRTHYAAARDTGGAIAMQRHCECGRAHYAKGQCRKCYAKAWWKSQSATAPHR